MPTREYRPSWQAMPLRVVAFLAMIALLVACGTSDESEDTVDGAAEGATSATDEATAPADAEDGTDGGGTEGPDEMGPPESSMTLYSSLVPALNDAVVEAFSEEYDVSVEVLRLASTPLNERYRAEAEAGNVVADVVIGGTAAFLEEAGDNDWVVELSENELPALAEWPSEFRSEYHVTTDITPFSITYNTENVSEDEAPKGWEDLADPKWEGRMLMADPRNSETWLAVFQLGAENLGDEFLTSFADLDYGIAESSVPGAQQVAAGEYDVMFPSAIVITKPLIDEGAPIADTILEGPSSGVEHFAGISAEASSPNAARAFVNWLLTQEGQQVVNEGLVSPLGELPGTLPMPEGYVSPPVGEAVENRDHIVELLELQ